MKPERLKEIRLGLGISAARMGRLFGYAGTEESAAVTIRKYESGMLPVPPALARLALMYHMHGVPEGWFDRWGKFDL